MSKELLVSWLQDAYAMEAALPSVLRAHAAHAKGIMPEVVERLREHAEETELHAERMRQALARVGAQPSIIRSALSAMIGPLQGITTGLFSDALVKDALVDLATEQFEVGCYDALIAAAHQRGEVEGRPCVEGIERRTTRWRHGFKSNCRRSCEGRSNG
jgi:ferritin-like metal-binding protein YciE